jgi:hypothetical protein
MPIGMGNGQDKGGVPRGICTLVAAALAFNIRGMAFVAKGRPR